MRGDRPVDRARAAGRGLRRHDQRPRSPPETTSNVSGAQWTPSSVFEDDHVDDGVPRNVRRAARLAYRRYQTCSATTTACGGSRTTSATTSPKAGSSAARAAEHISNLYPEVQTYRPSEHPFPTRVCDAISHDADRTEPLSARAAARLHRTRRPHRRAFLRFNRADDGARRAAIMNCTGRGREGSPRTTTGTRARPAIRPCAAAERGLQRAARKALHVSPQHDRWAAPSSTATRTSRPTTPRFGAWSRTTPRSSVDTRRPGPRSIPKEHS